MLRVGDFSCQSPLRGSYEGCFPHTTPPAGADGGLPGQCPPDTCSPTHARPALAGRNADENLISLTRPSVNNPNPLMQSGWVVLGEQDIVSFKGGFVRHYKSLSDIEQVQNEKKPFTLG